MLCSSFPSNFVYAPLQAENLNFGFTSLITDFVSGSFWTKKITNVLRTSSPSNCFHLDSDQAGKYLLPPFPGPRLKCTLSTLQCKYLHIELSPEITKLKRHQRNHLNNFCFDNLDSESLYPWRPDRTHLLKILQFSFPDYCWHNKNIISLNLSLRSVLLYLGQIYYENNDNSPVDGCFCHQ
ncbi:hypothetical protein AMECASPLE_022302 [Ameca splendens]|uniref:Uncharacterized protein n=1 Tax=Ameca splendens TaxID=208324 RepID=A0ABV0ZDV9_9TELE